MSNKYYHGVRVKEADDDIAVFLNGSSGLQVVIGTAPVNLADDPAAAVNVPVLCNNMDDARKKLGYSEDFEQYTLCQSMYANFVLYAVAPVIFINVLNPEKHKKENAEKEYNIINGQAVVDDLTGILKSSVIVKADESILSENADYLLSFNEGGNLIITMLADQESVKSIKVTSTSIDPSKVTNEDIIGGYDAKTGYESGFEVIRQVYPRTGMTPALLLAPGWSHYPDIGAVLIAKCENINGVFTAECLLDLDTSKTDLYTDVEQVKTDVGYQDRHAIVLWPMIESNGKKIYYSAVFGAMAEYTDATNDNVPSLYLSSKQLPVDKAVLENGAAVFMDRQQANTLNGAGIVTLISEGVWKSWGNNTSAYPETKNVKDRWIACRRMFTWMSNSLITTYNDRVDSPTNHRLIESICDSENIRLNAYTSDGKMPGGRIEYNETENTTENILSGQVVFHVHMAAFTPAEDIVFMLKFDPELLKDSLS